MEVIEAKECKDIRTILDQFPEGKREVLIPLLQSVQEEYGYLSQEMVTNIGEHLNLPSSKIYGVATFYNQFRFEPIGKYHIQVCRGTACHVKGSADVLEALKQELGIGADQTTKNGLFSLEVVACIGACGLAPVISINGEFYADLTPKKTREIIDEYRGKVEENDRIDQ